MRNKLKIIAISDTHGLHSQIEIPECDILIHAGDISPNGKLHHCVDFLEWFSVQPAQYKIFIAGNHDFLFQQPVRRRDFFQLHLNNKENVFYLEDQSVRIEGIKFYGSPWTPWFYDWAFNKIRGYETKEVADSIPHDTDVLITHGPPMGILDRTFKDENVGCSDLMHKVVQMKNLKYHIFGHIHESYGFRKYRETTFINASILNLQYKVTNKPFLFEV